MFAALMDTHAVIWYIYKDSRLSQKARLLIDGAAQQSLRIGFSTISLVETIYLIEKGRVAPETLDRLLNALSQSDSVLAEVPLDRYIARKVREIPRAVLHDPSDRIIAATALYLNVPLISRDAKIGVSGIETIW